MLLKKFKILKKFFLFYVLFSLMGFQDDNKIIWSKDIKLSWDDFKGNPIYVQGKGKRSRSVGAKSYVGIYCNLKYNYDAERYDIEIYSYFDKNASWVKYKTTGLSHEQGHFDIEEIYARRLKKIINSKKFFRHRLSLKIDKIVEVINQQCITYQELYDSETDFHNNFNKQIEWEIKIQKELNALDDYVKNNTFRVKTFGKGT